MNRLFFSVIIRKVSISITILFSVLCLRAQEIPPHYQTAEFSDTAYLRPFHGMQFNIPVVKVPTRYVLEKDSILVAENLRQWTGFMPAYVWGRPGGRQLKIGLTHIMRHDQEVYADSVRYRARGGGLFVSYDLFSQFFGSPPFVFAWFLGLDVEGSFHDIAWEGATRWEHHQKQFNLGVEWGMRWFITSRFYAELWMEPVSLQSRWVRWQAATTRRQDLRRGVLRFALGARF